MRGGSWKLSNVTKKSTSQTCSTGKQSEVKTTTKYSNITLTESVQTNTAQIDANGNYKNTYYYKISFTKTTTKNYTDTYTKYGTTATKQIAKTVIATNAPATQLESYKTFYLVKKGATHTIARNSSSFWESFVPSYWNLKDSSDSGSYQYTWSTSSSGQKASISGLGLSKKENLINNATNTTTWNIECKDLSEDVAAIISGCEGDTPDPVDSIDPPVNIPLCYDCTNSVKSKKTQVNLYETKEKAN